jgi:hypothetical protein
MDPWRSTVRSGTLLDPAPHLPCPHRRERIQPLPGPRLPHPLPPDDPGPGRPGHPGSAGAGGSRRRADGGGGIPAPFVGFHPRRAGPAHRAGPPGHHPRAPSPGRGRVPGPPGGVERGTSRGHHLLVPPLPEPQPLGAPPRLLRHPRRRSSTPSPASPAADAPGVRTIGRRASRGGAGPARGHRGRALAGRAGVLGARARRHRGLDAARPDARRLDGLPDDARSRFRQGPSPKGSRAGS